RTTRALAELSRRKLINASSSLIVPVGLWGFIRYMARVLAFTFDLSATRSFWYCAFVQQSARRADELKVHPHSGLICRALVGRLARPLAMDRMEHHQEQ